MLETDAEKPGQMPSEDGKATAGDAPPAAETPTPAESREALGATQGPLLAEEQPVATKKEEEQPSSLPAFVIPELRLDSTFSQSAAGTVGGTTDGEDEEEEEDEEDEDEEDEEEDSDEHYLERNEAKRSSMIETSGCQPVYTLSVQSSLRRRTHSEGSLLQEAKSHCFTSDTTLNCSDSQGTKGHWALPSPRTLKKELTKNGGSIHQLTLLFSGHRKVREPVLAPRGGRLLVGHGDGGAPGVEVSWHVACLSMAMAKVASEGPGRSLPLAGSVRRCVAPRGCHPEPVCWCHVWASLTSASRSYRIPCLGSLLRPVEGELHLGVCTCKERDREKPGSREPRVTKSPRCAQGCQEQGGFLPQPSSCRAVGGGLVSEERGGQQRFLTLPCRKEERRRAVQQELSTGLDRAHGAGCQGAPHASLEQSLP